MKTAVIIGNSQIDQIMPNKLSEKTNLVKITKYTIDDAEQWIESDQPREYQYADIIAIHEITNDVKYQSPQVVANKMINLVNKTKQAMPTTKILISLCTPRNDRLQGSSMEVNNIIRMNFGGQNRDPV